MHIKSQARLPKPSASVFTSPQLVLPRAVSRGQLKRTSRSMPSGCGCGCGSRQRERAHAQPQPRGGCNKPSQQPAAASRQNVAHELLLWLRNAAAAKRVGRLFSSIYLLKKKNKNATRKLESSESLGDNNNNIGFFIHFFLNEFKNCYFTQKVLSNESA